MLLRVNLHILLFDFAQNHHKFHADEIILISCASKKDGAVSSF